jgi:hypothetical protein
MAVLSYYPSERAAIEALEADGFKPSVHSEGVWVKPSKVDDWYGGYAQNALVRIKHHRVHPIHNKPDFYEWEFL